MTVQTATLADFLLARIAEDEKVANLARPDDHLTTRDRSGLTADRNAAGYSHVAATSGRVLAECEAKRRIVDEAQNYSPELSSGDNGEWALGMALRALALPYADHPDYRDDWRP